MSDRTLETPKFLSNQANSVHGLTESERDALIISSALVDGRWVIVSRYGDNIWQLVGFTSNVPASHTRLNFDTVPSPFREVLKEMLYRYLRRGREGMGRPKGAVLRNCFINAKPFWRHLIELNIDCLSAVTPLVCATYVTACKEYRLPTKRKGEPLSQNSLRSRFTAVEALYELSQYTDDPIPHPPWPGTSAKALAGLTASIPEKRTLLIPDDIFCALFERAFQQVERGQRVLDLRDSLDALMVRRQERHQGQSTAAVILAKNAHLSAHGWEGGVRAFGNALTELRTSCYIILASTSGCRNHELANLQSGAHHRTLDDEGTIYHWMRSRSEKEDVGIHDWMIPEVAVRALRVMERWAAPYQAMIVAEIAQLRRVAPYNSQIAEAQRHRHALFLGVKPKKNSQARTLSNDTWDKRLKMFAKECGLSWNLTTHQFRRKFANYAAHSRFGDLRYLKEHYAHSSLDMTLGYGMDDSWGQHLDLDLYAEIQSELEDIKLAVVDNWLGNEPLAGGYGQSLKRWKRDSQNLSIFRSHASMVKSIAESTAIRSNGHAWCTADDDGCVGNTLERTRCGNGCNNAVIGLRYAPYYKQLYKDLKGLLDCPDIGEGGRLRVERDLKRSLDVLTQLGIEPEKLIA